VSSPRLSAPLLASPRLSAPLLASPRLSAPLRASPRLSAPLLALPSGDGQIDLDEFRAMIPHVLDVASYPISDAQIANMHAKLLAESDDGMITPPALALALSTWSRCRPPRKNSRSEIERRRKKRPAEDAPPPRARHSIATSMVTVALALALAPRALHRRTTRVGCHWSTARARSTKA